MEAIPCVSWTMPVPSRGSLAARGSEPAGRRVVGTARGIFSAGQEKVSPASDYSDSTGQAEERAASTSWDKVLIILLTIAAVA